MVDWRANRLVDILAKNGAKAHGPREDVLMLVKSMTCMARHAAAQLGEATHVANNFPQEIISPEGKTVTKVTRDSMPKPKRIHVTPPQTRPPPPKPQKPKIISTRIAAWMPCEAPSKRARVASQNRKRAEDQVAKELAALNWRAKDVSKAVVAITISTERPPDKAFDRILKRLRDDSSCADSSDHTATFMRRAAILVDIQVAAKMILKRAREVGQARNGDDVSECATDICGTLDDGAPFSKAAWARSDS